MAKKTIRPRLGSHAAVLEPTEGVAGEMEPAIPEIARDIQDRATHVTHVLDEILHHHGYPVAPPTQWRRGTAEF